MRVTWSHVAGYQNDRILRFGWKASFNAKRDFDFFSTFQNYWISVACMIGMMLSIVDRFAVLIILAPVNQHGLPRGWNNVAIRNVRDITSITDDKMGKNY